MKGETICQFCCIMVRIFFFIGLLVSSVVTPAQPEKLGTDAVLLVRISGSTQSLDAVLEQISTHFRMQHSSVSESIWQQLHREILEPAREMALLQMAEVYQRHFTHDEIRVLIDFYSSPLGKKLTGLYNEINRDLVPVSRSWSSQLFLKTHEFLKYSGY